MFTTLDTVNNIKSFESNITRLFNSVKKGTLVRTIIDEIFQDNNKSRKKKKY